MTRILTFIIVCYQQIKHAFFPATCRFYPSCSAYSLLALKKYGALKGSCKAILRVLRCSPLSKGGYDPLT
ncbi:MAG TPA: membrane protein insertion efficiency factor YidD [Candidatus Omnitrophota bacterium]|nr:membrane protein insertion efficiency factor YidD [Candidatus Omnitrophota bacterium]HQL41198.1 membrane protein insertion efficiency factor YidD [Candidatus Omnitrophota bacterium]